MKIPNPIFSFLNFTLEKLEFKKTLIVILILNSYLSLSAQNQNTTFSLKLSEQSTYKNLTENNTLLFLDNNSSSWKIITGEAFGIPLTKTNKIVILLPKNSPTIFIKIQLKNTNNDIFNYVLDSKIIKEQKFESNYEWKEISFINEDDQIILKQSFKEILNN